jgi:beta-glucosidase
MSDVFQFPDRFLWGAATSAYQIEGSPLADGAGPSIWHRFSHTPGLTRNGNTGDVACDHYRRFEADVELMSQLGLNAYRFSISWSRVLPDGAGRVVDALLAHGIAPNATLYHWDLPAALDDKGGWLNTDIAEWFGEYAGVMFDALGDRVPMWATINEPWVVSDGGYLHGVLAPGHKNLFEAPIASHNQLRSHGTAVEVFRASRAAKTGKVGIVVNLEPQYAASDSAEDVTATARADAYMNRQYLDPIFFGRYPEEMKEIFGEAWVDRTADDMKLIAQPGDFLGINYYKRNVTRHDMVREPVRTSGVHQPDNVHTELGWEVFPPALTRILLWVHERYGSISLYITENGAAFNDPPAAIDGIVDDPARVEYLRGHLQAARDAMRQGVDLRGYFVWSLLDNYEWSHGYSTRFGIVHVNYETQERTVKSSGRFYSSVVTTNGGTLEESEALSEEPVLPPAV